MPPRQRESGLPAVMIGTVSESESVSDMTETAFVITATEATVTEAIPIVSQIVNDTAAAIGTASGGAEIEAGHVLQTRILTRMMKALFAIAMEDVTAAASLHLIVPVVAVVTTVAETTTVAVGVPAPGLPVAPAMMVVTGTVRGIALGTVVDVMMTGVVAAVPPPPRRIRTTVTSVQFSSSRSHSVQRLATFWLSSRTLAPLSKPKLSKTVSLDVRRGKLFIQGL